MSLQPKNKSIRVLSARVTQLPIEKQRPVSGKPSHTYTRKQLIISSYNSQGQDQNRAQSARQSAVNVISQNLESERYVRKVSVKQAKQKEQMSSQILSLKKTINRLVQQLSLHKGKAETLRKKNLKYTKLLETECVEQKQWGSSTQNNHLIAGIRHMYDTMKQKYEAKCQELEAFIKQQHIINHLESQQYIKALETEVKNLKKKLEKMNEVNLATGFSNQTQRFANQYHFSELQAEKDNIQQKYKQLEKSYKIVKQSKSKLTLKVEDKKMKIKKRDNTIHSMERKIQKLNLELQKINKLNLALDKEIQKYKGQYEKELQLHGQTISRYQEEKRKEIDSISMNKQTKISTLQKDNSYLQKMIQDLRSTNLELNKSNQELKQQHLKDSTRSYDESNNHIQKEMIAHNKVESKIINERPYLNGKRVPQKADKKYHQNAKKTRKIGLLQILQITQLIRLKLIGHQFSINQVKKLFDYRMDNGKINDEWQKEYITMHQTRQIFKASPFNLEQQDAATIARYLIEDVQAEYVYCDDFNENHREVVKSIIKSHIEAYPVYQNGSIQYSQMNQQIQRYGQNIRSALKVYAKQGVISRGKLMEVLKSIGMEIQPKIFQLIISKMALKSNNVNSLDYSAVF